MYNLRWNTCTNCGRAHLQHGLTRCFSCYRAAQHRSTLWRANNEWDLLDMNTCDECKQDFLDVVLVEPPLLPMARMLCQDCITHLVERPVRLRRAALFHALSKNEQELRLVGELLGAIPQDTSVLWMCGCRAKFTTETQLVHHIELATLSDKIGNHYHNGTYHRGSWRPIETEEPSAPTPPKGPRPQRNAPIRKLSGLAKLVSEYKATDTEKWLSNTQPQTQPQTQQGGQE